MTAVALMGDHTFLDPTGVQGLASMLAGEAALLDGFGSDAPGAPDAGASTGQVGDLLAAVSGAMADLVDAVGAASAGVQENAARLRQVDERSVRDLGGGR